MRNLSSRSLDRELDEADELPEPSRMQGDVIAFRRSVPGSGWGGCMMTMVIMKPPTCMDHGQQGAMRAGSHVLLSGLYLQHWPILSSLLMHSAARLAHGCVKVCAAGLTGSVRSLCCLTPGHQGCTGAPASDKRKRTRASDLAKLNTATAHVEGSWRAEWP